MSASTLILLWWQTGTSAISSSYDNTQGETEQGGLSQHDLPMQATKWAMIFVSMYPSISDLMNVFEVGSSISALIDTILLNRQDTLCIRFYWKYVSIFCSALLKH